MGERRQGHQTLIYVPFASEHLSMNISSQGFRSDEILMFKIIVFVDFSFYFNVDIVQEFPYVGFHRMTWVNQLRTSSSVVFMLSFLEVKT